MVVGGELGNSKISIVYSIRIGRGGGWGRGSWEILKFLLSIL